MSSSAWSLSLLGGVLVGVSALGVLVSAGKIAGLSGFSAELIAPRGRARSRGEAAAFLLGLVVAGALWARLWPGRFGLAPSALGGEPLAVRRWLLWILSGFLVGLGARLSGGCTSGHGVCGVGRLSLRSVVATALFVVAGALTVALVRHGGLR